MGAAWIQRVRQEGWRRWLPPSCGQVHPDEKFIRAASLDEQLSSRVRAGDFVGSR